MLVDQYLVFVENRKMVEWWASKHNGVICKGCGIPERDDFVKEIGRIGFSYFDVKKEGYSVYVILQECVADAPHDKNELNKACEKLGSHFIPFLNEFNIEMRTVAPKASEPAHTHVARFVGKPTGLVLKIKKLRPYAIVPTRVGNAAGYDLYTTEEIRFVNTATVNTGIAMKIPSGYYGRIASRSSMAKDHGIDVIGGVIDEDYRGEIKVVLSRPSSLTDCVLAAGDRIAQIIIEKCEHPTIDIVEEFAPSDATARGENGFGSTGK